MKYLLFLMLIFVSAKLWSQTNHNFKPYNRFNPYKSLGIEMVGFSEGEGGGSYTTLNFIGSRNINLLARKYFNFTFEPSFYLGYCFGHNEYDNNVNGISTGANLQLVARLKLHRFILGFGTGSGLTIARPFSNNYGNYAGLGGSFRLGYQINSKILIESQLNEFSDFTDGEMGGIGIRLIWLR